MISKVLDNIFMNKFRILYNKLFQEAVWKIAYRINTCHWPFEYSESFHTIPNTPKYWFADPLLIEYKGRLFVFCEAFNKKKNIGELAVMECVDGNWTNPKVVISNKYHMSYPFVFNYEGIYYMIPESAENNSLELYICHKFPYIWEKKCNLLENTKLADPTVIMKGKQIYLYAYTEKKGEYVGYLYNVDPIQGLCSLLHTKQYLANEGRPAGPVIPTSEYYIRSSQDSRIMYGQSIIWNKFRIVDEQIEETGIDVIINEKIIVDQKTGVDRIHTFSYAGNMEFIDYCEFKFDLLKRLKILKRKWDVNKRK